MIRLPVDNLSLVAAAGALAALLGWYRIAMLLLFGHAAACRMRARPRPSARVLELAPAEGNLIEYAPAGADSPDQGVLYAPEWLTLNAGERRWFSLRVAARSRVIAGADGAAESLEPMWAIPHEYAADYDYGVEPAPVRAASAADADVAVLLHNPNRSPVDVPAGAALVRLFAPDLRPWAAQLIAGPPEESSADEFDPRDFDGSDGE